MEFLAPDLHHRTSILDGRHLSIYSPLQINNIAPWKDGGLEEDPASQIGIRTANPVFNGT